MQIGDLIKDEWGFGVVIAYANGTVTVYWLDDKQKSTYRDERQSKWEVVNGDR